MGFFTKKRVIKLFAPATGTLKPMTEVNDEIFASKAMGDGYAVEPTDGAIYAPIAGEVISVFPTKHAIGLKSKDGLEVLLHLGINTVELGGKGFTTYIKLGDTVNEQTRLADVDLEVLATNDKPSDIIVIFTNLDKRKLEYTTGDVSAGIEIGTVQ